MGKDYHCRVKGPTDPQMCKGTVVWYSQINCALLQIEYHRISHIIAPLENAVDFINFECYCGRVD